MAHDVTGKMWTLGSATLGVITVNPICIDKIRITWSGASDGLVQLYTIQAEDRTADELILNATTLGAASATNGFVALTQEFDFGGSTFQGLRTVALTGVDANVGVSIQLK